MALTDTKEGQPFRPTYGLQQGTDVAESGNIVEDLISSKNSELRQWQYGEMSAQNARDWEKYMWDEANKYNSTSEQLKRWTEAGGNPNAFFSKDNPVAAQGGTAISGGGISGTAGTTAGNLANITNAATGAGKLYWEIQNLKEDAKTKGINNGTLAQMNEANLMIAQQQLQNLIKDGTIKDWEAKNWETMLPLTAQKTEAEIEQIRNNSSYLLAKTTETLENARYLDQRRKTEVYNTLREQWRNTFRETYGIDPDSNEAQAIIQGILGGHGEEIIGGFFRFALSSLKGTENLVDEWNSGNIIKLGGRILSKIPQFKLLNKVPQLNFINSGLQGKWRNHASRPRKRERFRGGF